MGDLAGTTEAMGIWRVWETWAGRTNASQGLSGVSCYIPIISLRFERNGVIENRKQDIRGENFGPNARAVCPVQAAPCHFSRALRFFLGPTLFSNALPTAMLFPSLLPQTNR